MRMIKKSLICFMIGLMFIAVNQPVFAGKAKVNINTAAKKELIVLKHVGAKIADKIIEYRKAHPFESPEDIMKVKGIGKKVYEANKEIIIVKDE